MPKNFVKLGTWNTYIHPYPLNHIDIYTYIHTYIHPYPLNHTYIHTYILIHWTIQTYIHPYSLNQNLLWIKSIVICTFSFLKMQLTMLEIIIETHCSSGACPTPPSPPPNIYDPLIIRSFSRNPYGSIKGRVQKRGRHYRLVPNLFGFISCGPQKKSSWWWAREWVSEYVRNHVSSSSWEFFF